MNECYCLQFLDSDWTIFCTTSLAVLAILDVVLGAVGLVPKVHGEDPEEVLVVPVVDGMLLVPAVDGEDMVRLVEVLIRVMVALAVDMEDMV